MISEERLDRIVEFVNKNQYASVSGLMKLVNASKSTIRRDLIQLSESGKICLVRGGAASLNKGFVPESAYQEKMGINIAEKQRIGKKAASLIQPGETIFIAPGTTTRTLFPNLADIENLNIITNDIQIANDMALNNNKNIFITGGWLRKDYYSMSGYQTEEALRSMKISTAFISCDAIDALTGCYIANSDEVGVTRQVIKSANHVVVMADHSKFCSNAFLQICDFSQVDFLITDDGLPSDILSLFKKKQNTKLIVV